jgi:aspartate aminotransferase-like enzyme/phosphoglycerate dehydrogenase-like enzyme
VTHTFGLSFLPPRVAQRVATTYGHHRTPWFEAILQDIAERLRPALGDRYTPLFLTCTGLGGREAIVSNLIRPLDRVLATPGTFAALARTWGANVETVRLKPDTNAIGFAPDAVLIEHVSASGALADVRGIVDAVRRTAPKAPIALDASISFGTDFIDVVGTGVDAVLIVPERGLMSIPGLTIVAVSDPFLETMTALRPTLTERPFLFDLLKHHRAWSKHTTPFSPNISAAVALQAALDEIDEMGGLSMLPERHRVRAEAIRESLATIGTIAGTPDSHTNAWTSVEAGADGDASAAAARLRECGFDVMPVERGFRVAHAGYMRDALERFRGLPIQPDLQSPIETPFTIDPAEFEEQSNTLSRRASTDPRVHEKIARSARRVFRDRHIVHADALRHRRVGFVGAGRIVTVAAELCRARGVEHLTVYSPSLAAAVSQGQRAPEGLRLVDAWRDRGVEVAPTLEELFETCHTIVLLPVVYDEASLRLFRKPKEYANHGLVTPALLDRAERAGRLDLLVNASARGALVDREALTRAVEQGWLRYYSDEMPAKGDRLIELGNARFTAHVGGSCRAPQAAVARNTHTILRRLLGELFGREVDGDDGYTLNHVNAHLSSGREDGRRAAAMRNIRDCGKVRVLLMDPFDVESLAFDRLRDLGVEVEAYDVSSGAPSAEKIEQTVSSFRPHVVMLRSRTRVDEAAARTMIAVDELAFVIRPGVGVDNLHGGMESLSAAGVSIINEPYGNSRAVAEMTLHFILSGTETTLLAPGPTNFNAEVFDVASEYDDVRLRDPFRPAAAIDRTLGAWLGAPENALTISGPGTALMEASIANLTIPGDRGLVISHGKFGDRFVEIARARGRDCEVLQVPEDKWGAAITPHDVDRFLQQDDERRAGTGAPPISFLCFQQNETSSGVTYHQPAIRALVQVARSYNPRMTIVADAISGALAHRLDLQALDLDILFLGSQKAVGVSSGLAFAVLGERALDAMTSRAGYAGGFGALRDDPNAASFLERFDRLQRVHSTNLLRAAIEARRHRYVDTPSLFHLLSTERALQLLDDGPEAVAERHAVLAQLARDGVRRLGLDLMPSAPFESDSVTVVILPAGIDASAIRKLVAKNTGIAIAGAQGDFWKPRMLRIGTLGFVDRSDVARCLRALRQALAEVGYAATPASDVVGV